MVWCVGIVDSASYVPGIVSFSLSLSLPLLFSLWVLRIVPFKRACVLFPCHATQCHAMPIFHPSTSSLASSVVGSTRDGFLSLFCGLAAGKADRFWTGASRVISYLSKLSYGGLGVRSLNCLNFPKW